MALLAFFGFFNVYALRVNLSVAVVAMTEKVETKLDNGTVVFVSICIQNHACVAARALLEEPPDSSGTGPGTKLTEARFERRPRTGRRSVVMPPRRWSGGLVSGWCRTGLLCEVWGLCSAVDVFWLI